MKALENDIQVKLNAKVIVTIKQLQERGAISYFSSLELVAMVKAVGVDGAKKMYISLRDSPEATRIKPIEECKKFLGILIAVENKLQALADINSYNTHAVFAAPTAPNAGPDCPSIAG